MIPGRTFTTNPSRFLHSMEGNWGFHPLPDDWNGDLPDSREIERMMFVPGCWDATVDFACFRGLACYARALIVEEAPLHRLVFGAVSHTAIVYVDGREVGRHYGAHTRFEIPLVGLEPGVHDLHVVVDNRFSDASTLHAERNDWHTHGGIMGTCYFEELPEIFIRQVRCVRQKIGRSSTTLDIELVVENCAGETRKVDYSFNPEEGRDLTGSLEAPPGESVTSLKCNIGNPPLWTPDEPNLFSFAAVLNDGEDIAIDRTGLRTVEVAGDEILLNGEPLRLRGVNRHEFHPHFGQSLPPQIHLRDLDMIRDAGFNFIRGSHYPNDPYFLDLCDERGFLFWEEAPQWQIDEELIQTDLFFEQSSQCLREMIQQHINHPSIIMWGLLNESRTDFETSVEPVKKQVDLIRELDSSRPVTYACSRIGACRVLPLFDIVSLNTYPGWYIGGLDAIEPRLDEIKDWIDSIEDLMPRPVILSEFGAGAIRGVHQAEALQWSEEYQADLLARFLEAFEDRDWIKGYAIWQWCDIRSTAPKAMRRPRSYNNKGLVDEFRQPKIAYREVRKFHEFGGDLEELGQSFMGMMRRAGLDPDWIEDPERMNDDDETMRGFLAAAEAEFFGAPEIVDMEEARSESDKPAEDGPKKGDKRTKSSKRRRNRRK